MGNLSKKAISNKQHSWWANTQQFWLLDEEKPSEDSGREDGRLAGRRKNGSSKRVRQEDEPSFAENSQLMPEEGYFRQSISPSELDYRRAVTSIALRGLKDKTQVFPLDQENFVRTRLSHSLEVMANADTILSGVLAAAKRGMEKDDSRNVREKKWDEYKLTEMTSHDIERLRYSLQACCLLHDAGNPPFGHFGEQVIRKWFKEHCAPGASSNGPSYEIDYCGDLAGYEGNANSLRIALQHAGLYDGRRMNLTGTTISAMVKYPWFSEQCGNRGSVKYSFFESEREAIDNLGQVFGVPDFKACERHPLSFVMEAADDISYVVGDFEDGFRKRKFTVSEAVEYLLERLEKEQDGESAEHLKATYCLIYLLALIAGEQSDVARCRATCERVNERMRERRGDPFDLAYYLHSSNTGEGPRRPFSYLVPDDAHEGESRHTFESACRSNPVLDATQRWQLQETYVARWVDIVRKWLCFSAAVSLCEKQVKVFSGLDADMNRAAIRKAGNRALEHDGFKGGALQDEGDAPDERTMRNVLFGSHAFSVKIIHGVMEEFAFDDSENLRLNLRAEAVLGQLLDRFIPAAMKCVDNAEDANKHIDVVGLSGLEGADKALMLMIPMRFRMDCQQRFKPNWQQSRQRYELAMMVLDFLASLTDEGAIALHESIH